MSLRGIRDEVDFDSVRCSVTINSMVDGSMEISAGIDLFFLMSCNLRSVDRNTDSGFWVILLGD